MGEHGYGIESDCTCGRNFPTVQGLREHLTKARQTVAEHDHRCFQRTGVPADLPPDVCDCRIWAVIDSRGGDA